MDALKEHGYRKNVAIVVVNSAGKILACRRSDKFRTWQLPQGGVDDNESAEEAMYRELEEEIGTSSVHLIGQLPDAIRYDWPDHLRKERGFLGQEQIYFLVQLDKDATIDLKRHHTPEFETTEWLGISEFLTRVEGFKAEAYRAGLEQLHALFPDKMEL